MKDKTEINEACKRACDMHDQSRETGSKYRGMTYEEGVRDALDWVLEHIDEDPTEN